MLVSPGIHHVTAIASDPQKNLDFYAGVLGMRLVKRTVNFDDPTTYHFYFGDAEGNPGSILTFFPWPGSRRGRALARVGCSLSYEQRSRRAGQCCRRAEQSRRRAEQSRRRAGQSR